MSSVAILAFNEIYRVRIWKSRVQLNAVFTVPKNSDIKCFSACMVLVFMDCKHACLVYSCIQW